MAKKLRAVGYCRTSSEGQRDNSSILVQRDTIKAFCKSNDWSSAKCYVDESRSGSKIDGRDDFKRMLKDAADDQFDIIVVYSITRFGRDGADIIKTAEFLKSTFTIYTVSAKKDFDNRKAKSTLLNFVNAGVSEHERLSIMDRTISGRIKNAKDGKLWTNNPPIGRAYDKATGEWSVTDKGRAIAEILRRYLKGERLIDLCTELGQFRDPGLAIGFGTVNYPGHT